MKFRSAYSVSEKVANANGSKFRKKFIKHDTSGELIENGIENVYDSIQKAAMGISVNDLIARAQRGDTTAIGPELDSFGDISHLPKDFVEAHMMTLDYKAKFNSLPVALRREYNNNFSEFLSALSDGSIKDKLKASPATKDNTTQPLSSEEVASLRKIIGGSANA